METPTTSTELDIRGIVQDELKTALPKALSEVLPSALSDAIRSQYLTIDGARVMIENALDKQRELNLRSLDALDKYTRVIEKQQDNVRDSVAALTNSFNSFSQKISDTFNGFATMQAEMSSTSQNHSDRIKSHSQKISRLEDLGTETLEKVAHLTEQISNLQTDLHGEPGKTDGMSIQSVITKLDNRLETSQENGRKNQEAIEKRLQQIETFIESIENAARIITNLWNSKAGRILMLLFIVGLLVGFFGVTIEGAQGLGLLPK